LATATRSVRAPGWKIIRDLVKRDLATAVGVVLLIIAIAVVLNTLPHPQSKPPAFGELMPVRAAIPVQSNGFALLLQAGKLLSISNNEPILANYTNWDETAARDILARNETALDALRRAWACPLLQVEAVTNIEQEFPYLSDWRHLAQLAIVEAHLSFSSNQQQGFTQAVEVVRFGQRLQEADGAHIHYLVGAAIKSLGLNCLRHFAGETRLSASNLVLVSEELTNFESSQAALRQTLKVEYLTSAKLIETMATNPIACVAYIYSVDRTKRDLADQLLLIMRALTNCYATGVTVLPVAQTNPSYVKFLLHGNLMGTVINNMTLDSRTHMLAAKCRENVSVRATRLVLALRAFQIENQRQAGLLEELVPNFVEAVPLDDFDGKPLRYSPSLNEVYSVGVGLIDSGGVESTNSRTGNILFPLR
jgi:hypothetical protein